MGYSMAVDRVSDNSKIVYQIYQRWLDSQDDTIKIISTKAGIILASCSVLLSIGNKENYLFWESITLLLLFSFSILFSIIAVWPRIFELGAKPDRAKEIFSEYTNDQSLDWLERASKQSLDRNTRSISRAICFLRISMILFALGAIATAIFKYF